MIENERYTKHYVNVLNSTLTETLMRNVQMQANAQFVDELVGELNQENESLKLQVQEMGEQLKLIVNEKDEDSEQVIKNKSEMEKVRHQLDHLETFRNQLIESQNMIEEKDREIEKLKNKIKNLQSPRVTKNKKNEVLNTPIEVEDTQQETVKDGGVF